MDEACQSDEETIEYEIEVITSASSNSLADAPQVIDDQAPDQYGQINVEAANKSREEEEEAKGDQIQVSPEAAQIPPPEREEKQNNDAIEQEGVSDRSGSELSRVESCNDQSAVVVVAANNQQLVGGKIDLNENNKDENIVDTSQQKAESHGDDRLLTPAEQAKDNLVGQLDGAPPPLPADLQTIENDLDVDELSEQNENVPRKLQQSEIELDGETLDVNDNEPTTNDIEHSIEPDRAVAAGNFVQDNIPVRLMDIKTESAHSDGNENFTTNNTTTTTTVTTTTTKTITTTCTTTSSLLEPNNCVDRDTQESVLIEPVEQQQGQQQDVSEKCQVVKEEVLLYRQQPKSNDLNKKEEAEAIQQLVGLDSNLDISQERPPTSLADWQDYDKDQPIEHPLLFEQECRKKELDVANVEVPPSISAESNQSDAASDSGQNAQPSKEEHASTSDSPSLIAAARAINDADQSETTVAAATKAEKNDSDTFGIDQTSGAIPLGTCATSVPVDLIERQLVTEQWSPAAGQSDERAELLIESVVGEPTTSLSSGEQIEDAASAAAAAAADPEQQLGLNSEMAISDTERASSQVDHSRDTLSKDNYCEQSIINHENNSSLDSSGGALAELAIATNDTVGKDADAELRTQSQVQSQPPQPQVSVGGQLSKPELESAQTAGEPVDVSAELESPAAAAAAVAPQVILNEGQASDEHNRSPPPPPSLNQNDDNYNDNDNDNYDNDEFEKERDGNENENDNYDDADDGGDDEAGNYSPSSASHCCKRNLSLLHLGDDNFVGDDYDDSEDLEREFDEEPECEQRNVVVKRNVDPRAEYELGAELGRGRFGTVFKCTELASGRQLAAKFICMRRREDREDVEREVAIMRLLQHKRLLQLYDAYDNNCQEMCLITELVEGGELFERIVDDDFDLTEKKAAIFMRQICEGVEYMHGKQIVHLDMKPENILCLSRTGYRIKLIDFGLARQLDPQKPIRVMFGTPDFAAPEVLGYELVTLATDMWSVGVICYVLLSGLSPFMGENDMDTMANVTRATYDFNDHAFEPISELAKDFIAKLLLRQPEKRLKPGECLKHPWLQRGGAQLEMAVRDRRESTSVLHRMAMERAIEATAAAAAALAAATSGSNAPVETSPQLQQHQQLYHRPSFGAESTASSGLVSLDKRRLKRYVVRRKWHRIVHAIMALNRMGANLVNKFK